MRASLLKIISIGLLLLLPGVSGFAQPTAEEAADLRREALLKLSTFLNYVQKIGNRGEDGKREIYDDETKLSFIHSAVELFKPDAKMEVTSYNRKNAKFYDIDHYLYRLKDSLRYDFIDINFVADAIYFTEKDLKPVLGLPNTYSGIITVVQRFEGYYNRDGERKVGYVDEVKKNVEVIATRRDDPTGVNWLVILGDISASETKKL